MTEQRIQELLGNIHEVDVGVYGDFCLDAYWILDPDGSEESVETGVRAEAVKRHYYSPGGASNVAANMAALGPKSIRAIGSIGSDIFGREILRLLDKIGVDTNCLIIQEDNFDTLAFNKHYSGLDEKLRVDFGTGNKRSVETDQRLLAGLEIALDKCDLVIFNQQVPGTLANDEFILKADELFERYQSKTVLIDSRHYGAKFHSVARKINEVEAAWLCDAEASPRDVIDRETVIDYGRELHKRSGKPVFITRGSKGIMAFDRDGWADIPGIQTDDPLDTVGAGDTTLSAIALCLGAGAGAAEAAELANTAASVTVQKLRRTGTASGDEVLQLSREVRYIYQPELAADARREEYLPGTSIETCSAPPRGTILYALFDHDGTISTLRYGWEKVMAPVMMNAILGSGDHPDDTVQKTRERVLEYIDRSTGIQTILQMESLREMVREAGIIPENEILTAPEYKEIFNTSLIEIVKKRMEAIKQGEMEPGDFVIKGTLDFLKYLREKGITIFLASGTDREDVRREAEYLGYADLFNGGIYGAVGDIRKYSKKKLLENIIEEKKLNPGELLVVGDGPVEIQECRRQNGTAIGVASTEEAGQGLNLHKRTRLIRAGAHFVIPDLSPGIEILNYLENR